MQIFFPPPAVAILLCFAVWGIFQTFFALLCAKLPARFFCCNGSYFSSKNWENEGKIYEYAFKIRRWKRFLPDGSAITKIGLRKKRFSDYSVSGLQYFLEESCRAEMSHLLAFLTVPLFGLFCTPTVMPIMFLYALLSNLPCIMAQRFNRPRFLRRLQRIQGEI